MNPRISGLGIYLPGDSPAHRWPAWIKYLLMFGMGLPPFFLANLWVSAASLALSVIILLVLARIPPGIGLSLPVMFWVMMGILVGYHALFTTLTTGVLYLLNLLTALCYARILTMTTPVGALMDAVAKGLRPLEAIGVNSQKAALAFALMWRSIPYLLGSVAEVRAAARARGIQAHALRFITPVIVGAVGYGLTTGDAIRARGLDERETIEA